MALRDNSIPVVLTAPAGVATFDPTNRYSTMWIEECSFTAAVAAERSKRPRAHGAYLDNGTKDGGVWDAQIRIIGGDAALDTNRVALLKALNSMLGEDGTGTMVWTDQGTTTPKRLSGLQLLDETGKVDGNSYLWHVQLAAEMPCAEDNVSVTTDSSALSAGGGGFVVPLTIPVTLTASSAGQMTVTNSGTFKAYPVLRVYGPITNPVVSNQTASKRLTFTGSVAAGDYWEISLFSKTVTLNGVTNVTTLDVPNSDWFTLGLGSTTLQLSGSAFSASTLLRCYMRSCWA